MPVQAQNKKVKSIKTRIHTGKWSIEVNDILTPKEKDTERKQQNIKKLNRLKLQSDPIKLKAIILDFNNMDLDGFCTVDYEENFEVNPVLYCVNTMRIDNLLKEACDSKLSDIQSNIIKEKFIKYETDSDRKVIEHLLYLCDLAGLTTVFKKTKKNIQEQLKNKLIKLKKIYNDKEKWTKYIESTQFREIKKKICDKYRNHCDLSTQLVKDIENMYN